VIIDAMKTSSLRIAMLVAIIAPFGGYCSAVTRDGWRWIVDAHREGRRYAVHSDELLSAILELEATLLGDASTDFSFA
jgi:hypothetical protein